MFSKRITDGDAFIEMPSATQALYFHLNQAADDDGFNNQIQVAMMKSHAGADDLKVLLMKRFIIRFESGVIVIKHWRMHNTLRKDRYTPTAFQTEFAQLNIKENQSYSLPGNNIGCQVVAERLPQYSIDKISIDKYSIPPKGDELFNQFWKAYPKKKSKGDAEKAWKVLKPDTDLLEKMLNSIASEKLSKEWLKDDGQFIPYPATWLRAKGWEDETTAQLPQDWGYKL